MTEPNLPSPQAGSKGRRRRAGVIGAAVGVAAAGVAAGVATQRLVTRRARRSETDLASEPFGRLPFDESLTVRSDDGIDLYVEIIEPSSPLEAGTTPVEAEAAPRPTVVFVHGFCLDMGTFHFQRRDLAQAGQHRLVLYDQPGHGRSSKLKIGEYTLDMLGRALGNVIDATVPTGPIVLVGHSMGGMTIMALAEAHPELFGPRVVGVVFISTSAGNLEQINLGLPAVLGRFSRQLVPLISTTGRAGAGVIDAARRASSDLAWLLTRRYGFGSARADPALVSYVERMNGRTSTDVVARYIRALNAHARYPALEALREIDVLAICGDRDQLTPLSHSEEICRMLPKASLVVVPEAGHVALMEYPDIVTDAIAEFLDELMP
ncbi:MAG TPA: alpha/beta hydrolase [Micromonosporaceae bacterium]|nr:alpha/beta hydrolase [Micromonosporaceae bacterium]